LVIECLYCTNPKDHLCDFCKDPVCTEHAKYDLNTGNVFCGFGCAKRFKRFGGGSKIIK
jgi:hypothetical protein